MGSMLLVHVTLRARKDVMLFMPLISMEGAVDIIIPPCSKLLLNQLTVIVQELEILHLPLQWLSQLCTKCPLEVKGRG